MRYAATRGQWCYATIKSGCGAERQRDGTEKQTNKATPGGGKTKKKKQRRSADTTEGGSMGLKKHKNNTNNLK